MEVAGMVFRQASCFPSNNSTTTANSHKLYSYSYSQSKSIFYKRKSVISVLAVGCDEFSDKSHLQYYDDKNSGSKMSIKEKEMKKQLKLVKGLSKNLGIFSDMGFGLNLDNGLDEQVRGKMISEATEVLVEQLKKLKAEKMELKMRKKEEKARKKAAKMMNSKHKDSSSSSSSESECEKLASSNVIEIEHGETTSSSSLMLVEEIGEKKKSIDDNKIEVCMGGKCKKSGAAVLLENFQRVVGSDDMVVDEIGEKKKSIDDNKIEVCMGGKCKKSGAAVLLENFQRVVGSDDMVVGCKCMGKCKDGPNVKLVKENPLCMMGVGLEDVDSIVNNYFFGIGTPSPSPSM